MSNLFVKRTPVDARDEVSVDNPLPVSIEVGTGGVAVLPTGVQRYATPLIVVPGMTTGIYAADDAVGTKFQIPVHCTSGIIDALALVDLDAQSVAYDLLLFDADFTSVADNAAFDLLDGERGAFVGQINIPAANQVVFGTTETLATVKDIQFPFVAPLGILFAVLTTQGTPTFAGAPGVLSLRLVIRQDA